MPKQLVITAPKRSPLQVRRISQSKVTKRALCYGISGRVCEYTGKLRSLSSFETQVDDLKSLSRTVLIRLAV